MYDCPNTLCAYNIKRTNNFKCTVFDNLVKNCMCYQAFVEFSKTIDIDREFNSGCGSYHQWQEIKRGDLPKISKEDDRIKKRFPMMIAEQLASVQPIKEDLSIFKIMEESDFKWKEGDYGHNFVHGYFVVNEELEEIYRDNNPEEYDRLMTKYSILKEQKKKMEDLSNYIDKLEKEEL